MTDKMLARWLVATGLLVGLGIVLAACGSPPPAAPTPTPGIGLTLPDDYYPTPTPTAGRVIEARPTSVPWPTPTARPTARPWPTPWPTPTPTLAPTPAPPDSGPPRGPGPRRYRVKFLCLECSIAEHVKWRTNILDGDEIVSIHYADREHQVDFGSEIRSVGRPSLGVSIEDSFQRFADFVSDCASQAFERSLTGELLDPGQAVTDTRQHSLQARWDVTIGGAWPHWGMWCVTTPADFAVTMDLSTYCIDRVCRSSFSDGTWPPDT